MQSAPIELASVRAAFNRPERRAPADFVYREIAGRMMERLQLVRLDPAHVLDAGCGRGADLGVLQNNYPKAHVLGLDGSHLLLSRVLKERAAADSSLQRLMSKWLFSKGTSSNSQMVTGNFGATPFADQSMDLVWSNLALHWHPEPDQVFKEWRRLLRTNGLLMFSSFGPDSLKEIRTAFDGSLTPHTLPFVDMHDFGDMLVNAGFSTPVMDMEVITLTYETVDQLLTEVRALGGNPLATRNKSLTGKLQWNQMRTRLDGMRAADGRIPLTLEIIYGHAFKPMPKTNKSGESVIQFIDRRN